MGDVLIADRHDDEFYVKYIEHCTYGDLYRDVCRVCHQCSPFIYALFKKLSFQTQGVRQTS